MWYRSEATLGMNDSAKEYIHPLTGEACLWVYNELEPRTSKVKPTIILTSDPFRLADDVSKSEVEKFLDVDNIDHASVEACFCEDI